MRKVLVVEDSKALNLLFKKKIERELACKVVSAYSFKDAQTKLNKEKDFFVALADLTLPDALDGEVVDLILSFNIPTIVVTGRISDEMQDEICSKKIVDYVIKDNSANINHIISLIKRLKKNEKIKVLVVDDSPTSRKIIVGLLKVHKYIVHEACDGKKALSELNKHPDIKMIITDYHMPKMDGFELSNEIRRKYDKNQKAIIGMSSGEDNRLSAKFIKCGANDFINKPFRFEEFYCRLAQNMLTLEYIETIKDISHRDYLTGLFNRRYFYEAVQHLTALLKREDKECAVAMIDIDFFKKVNDTYGHKAGDLVLQKVAELLKSRFRASDIVSRFGGEEFCVFAYDMHKIDVYEIFEILRCKIEKMNIKVDKEIIKVTVSIGVCTEMSDSIEDMINRADDNLYNAKETGRNKVIMDF